jgi:hypothetical protein
MKYWILNFFVIEISNELKKLGFEKKISSTMCSHLEKTCLPCNSNMISFHIWIFENWIYTLHNNVHMLKSRYIYVMGSHSDQSCMPHYLPCKTMFLCWVTPCWANITFKKYLLDLVFQIDFENWTSYLVFFKTNAFKKYFTSFWECQIYNQTISIRYSN